MPTAASATPTWPRRSGCRPRPACGGVADAAVGIIRGYTALIDEPDVANPTIAIVQITLERQTEEYLARFEAAVRKCPEVDQCYLMTGMSDYLLRVVARDTADYERIHKEQLSRMPGVSRIQSAFTLRSVIRGNSGT